jgi:hypothetical protein
VPNLIKDLEPSGVDQVWVSDITYAATVLPKQLRITLGNTAKCKR